MHHLCRSLRMTSYLLLFTILLTHSHRPHQAFATDTGLPNWPYADQGVWRHAVIEGRRVLQAHAASCRKPLRLNKMLRTGEYRFRVSHSVSFPHPFRAIAPSDQLRAVTVLDGLAPGPYVGHDAGPNAAYLNLVDPQHGVIVGADVDRAEDKSRRLHLSDVLFESYARVADLQAHYGRRAGQLDPKFRSRIQPGLLPPLRYVVLAAITTPETIRVCEIAHRKRAAQPAAMQAFEPGHEAEGPGEDFSALAGTIGVKSILHLLRDYCGWARRRRLARIRTQYVSSEHGREHGGMNEGWYMLLEFE